MKYVIALLLSILASGHACATADPPPETLLWGFCLEGFPLDEKVILNLQQQTTLTPQLINFFMQWPAPGEQQKPLTSTLEAIWQSGAAPCMTWEPMYYENDKRFTVPINMILEGGYNAYLKQFAAEIKAWKHPVIVRLAHEMNLQEYHWGTKEEYNAQSPGIYVGLYRYLVTFCREQGVDNILWAFCPNAESSPAGNDPKSNWNCVKCYYPGDDFVDILGMDGYNWGKPDKPFELIFGALYNELKAIAPGKPIVVFETSTVSEGEERSQWILEAIAQAQKWRLNGLVWFQVNKEHAWQLRPPFGPEVTAIRQASSPSQQWLQHAAYHRHAEVGW